MEEADLIAAGHYAMLLEVDSGPIRFVVGRDVYPATGPMPGPDQPIWPWLVVSAYRHALHQETSAAEEEFVDRRGFVEWWNEGTTGDAREMPIDGSQPGPGNRTRRPHGATSIDGPDNKRRRIESGEDE